MADETRDESKITASLEEMQHQIADLREQLQVIAFESDAFLDSEKKRHIQHSVVCPIMLRGPSRGVMAVVIVLLLESCQNVSHSGRTTLTISYPEHQMTQLRISRASSQIPPSSLF